MDPVEEAELRLELAKAEKAFGEAKAAYNDPDDPTDVVAYKQAKATIRATRQRLREALPARGVTPATIAATPHVHKVG